MKKSLKFILPVLAIVVAVAASIMLFVSRPEVEHQPLNIKAPLVTVTAVKAEQLSIPVFTRGTVTPGTEIQMVSEVSGQVLELSPNFANGGFFRKGEVLVRIDPIEYEVNIKRAEASKAQANQAMLQAEAEKKARSRVKNTSRSKLATYDIQYRQAKAQYEATVAELEAVKLQKARTTIRAPFDGRVRLAALNVGQYVRPGQQMGSIYAVDVAEVRLPLSDRQLSLVDVPMRFQDSIEKVLPEVILTDEYAGRTYSWKGKVVRAEGGLDERNRLLYVVAQVRDPYAPDPNQPGRPELVAGSFVEATIDGREFSNVYQVPRKALRNGTQLWVVDDNDRLVEKEVAIIYKAKDHIYVSSGLENGDKVVLSQMDIAVEGMQVRTQVQEDFEPEIESKAKDDLFGNNKKSTQSLTLKMPDANDPKVQEAAKKAKEFYDDLSDDKKQQIKTNAKQLLDQVKNLQQSVADVKSEPEVVPEAEQQTVQPTVESKSAGGMSPLAMELEQDIARQQQEEQQPEQPQEQIVAQAEVEPAYSKPSPNTDSANAEPAPGFVTATITAPKPLMESAQ